MEWASRDNVPSGKALMVNVSRGKVPRGLHLEITYPVVRHIGSTVPGVMIHLIRYYEVRH